MAFTKKDIDKLFRPINERDPQAKPLLFKSQRCDTLDWGCNPIEGRCIVCKRPEGSEDAYVQLTVNREHKWLHRMVWELVNGPIREGWEIDHRCQKKTCVNPDHLVAMPKWLHKYKTDFVREVNGRHDERDAAIAFMLSHPKVQRKEVADVFEVSPYTIRAWENLIKQRTAAFNEMNMEGQLDGNSLQQPDHTQ